MTKRRLILPALLLVWILAIIAGHVSDPGFHNVESGFHRVTEIVKDLASQIIWLIFILNLSVRINRLSVRQYSIAPFLTSAIGVYVYINWYDWPGVYYREACLEFALLPFQIDANGEVFNFINLDFYLGLATVLSDVTLNTCRIAPNLAIAVFAVIASAGLMACHVAFCGHYAEKER